MKKIKFYAKCLIPVLHLTVGRSYEILSKEGENKYVINNDEGNKVTIATYIFDDIYHEKNNEVETPKVKCIANNNFKGINIGDTYDVVKKDDNFIYIINKFDKTAKYAHRYFKEIVEEVIEEIVEENNDVPIALCIHPIRNELTFKKKYSFKEDEDPRFIIIINDGGEESKYIRKRFEF